MNKLPILPLQLGSILLFYTLWSGKVEFKNIFVTIAYDVTKTYFFWLMIASIIPLVFLFLLHIFNEGSYEAKKYYKVLKVITHLQGLLLVAIIIAIIFGFLEAIVNLDTNNKIIGRITSIIFYFTTFIFIWAIIRIKYSINIFNPLIWLKK